MQTQKSKELKIKSASAEKEPKFFQGIGVIDCLVEIKNKKLVVKIDERTFLLKPGDKGTSKYWGYQKLEKDIIKSGPKELRLRVYPKAYHCLDTGETEYWFVFVRAYHDKSECKDIPDNFIFRGVWQILPYCPKPAISVYRNLAQIDYFKGLSHKVQAKFVKPQSFPVIWSDSPKPFCFDPQISREDQPPRYFVQVRTVLKDGNFEVVEVLDEPSLIVPKRLVSLERSSPTKSSVAKPILA